MDWLNYHHLLYFWTVAREGGVTAAATALGISPSTVSDQLRQLETSLGLELFNRVGRRLVLTDAGNVVARYAEEIFTLGREMVETVKEGMGGRPLRLEVGIADVVPKLVSRKLLEPALSMDQPVRLFVREGDPEQLLADLATHHLDVVISDAPLGRGANVRAYDHLVVEGGLKLFATPTLARKYRRGYPDSLADAPMLLPAPRTSKRRAMDQWLSRHGLLPRVIGEFEDSALMKEFARIGAGLFPASTIIEDDVCRQFGVRPVGEVDGVVDRYYAVTVERRLKHPAVVQLVEVFSQS